MAGMLAPYRVLDLTDEGGQLAGFLFAQLGAEVVLVEGPSGSPARGGPEWWDAYARGKRSVALDLDADAGREALRRLVAGADVLLESAGPGELAARGLGPDALLALNPRLVVASITPFGGDGPHAAYAATDLVVQAAGGQMAISGDEDRAPVRISLPQAMMNASIEAV
jgi:crotonobetainyl-CoA:carnitine CoA-transferase CaiB-like acyl-CoA transferase